MFCLNWHASPVRDVCRVLFTSLTGIWTKFKWLLASHPIQIFQLICYIIKLFIIMWIWFFCLQFCIESSIDYLTIRVYIGFWLFVISLLVSFFEGSVLVKIFTRFISEIFATLISLLYIMESIMKIFAVSSHKLLNLH